jgi:selenoprotein W-related protein
MAAGLAAELRESLGVQASLVPGSGGIYQVHLDGELVFDKKVEGRYPILGEVTARIRELRPELE